MSPTPESAGKSEKSKPSTPAEGAMKQTSKTAAEVDAQSMPAQDSKAGSPAGGDSVSDQSRQDRSADTRSPGTGETHWSQASSDGLQSPVPKQPTERDESASSQAASSASMDAIGKVAHHDAETGVDTDRGPVLDAVYNGAVTEGHRVGDEEDVKGERDPAKSTSSRAAQKR